MDAAARGTGSKNENIFWWGAQVFGELLVYFRKEAAGALSEAY